MSNKNHTISSSWNENLLIITISGIISNIEDANEVAENFRIIIDDKKPRKVLIKCTELKGRLSITDTYFHVRNYKRYQHSPEKVAVLDKVENKSYYLFHETTAANVGFNAKFFSDLENAIFWLQK